MYMKMGKLNRQNPDKITSNTHIQNPTQMTAQFLFKRNFADLNQEQKVAVYSYLTPIQTDQNGRPSIASKGMSQEVIDQLYKKDSEVVKSQLGNKLDQRDNSPEFKKLAQLHPDARTITYIPQENKVDFRSQPKYSYTNKINLKLKRDKLSSSPITNSPRDSRSPRNRTSNTEGYFLNLRKKSNNTELQKNEELRASLSNYYTASQENDPKFIRAVEEGYEMNQNKVSQIT